MDNDDLGRLFVQYEPNDFSPCELRPAGGSTAGSAIPATMAIVTNAGSALDGDARPYATRGSALPATAGMRRPEVYSPVARHQEFRRDEASTKEISTVEPQRRDRALSAGRPKAQATRSSARSGDSPGDGGPSDEPPQDGRPPCACGCGLSMVGKAAQAKYLNDAHRKRAQRERDRLDPDRPAERRLLQLVQDRPPAPVRCKCDPRPQLVDENVCVPCGRPRGSAAAAWLNEAANLRSKPPSSRAPARRNPRYGDRKRKPVTPFVDESIITKVAA